METNKTQQQFPRVYSEFVAAGMILPKKAKYTVRDAKAAQVSSLFSGPTTLTNRQAVAIVKMSAVFHDTDWASKPLSRFSESVIS